MFGVPCRPKSEQLGAAEHLSATSAVVRVHTQPLKTNRPIAACRRQRAPPPPPRSCLLVCPPWSASEPASSLEPGYFRAICVGPRRLFFSWAILPLWRPILATFFCFLIIPGSLGRSIAPHGPRYQYSLLRETEDDDGSLNPGIFPKAASSPYRKLEPSIAGKAPYAAPSSQRQPPTTSRIRRAAPWWSAGGSTAIRRHSTWYGTVDVAPRHTDGKTCWMPVTLQLPRILFQLNAWLVAYRYDKAFSSQPQRCGASQAIVSPVFSPRPAAEIARVCHQHPIPRYMYLSPVSS